MVFFDFILKSFNFGQLSGDKSGKLHVQANQRVLIGSADEGQLGASIEVYPEGQLIFGGPVVLRMFLFFTLFSKFLLCSSTESLIISSL